MSARYDYSEWDGTQEFADLDPDDLLAGLTDDLLAGGDLDDALRRLLRSGFHTADGDQVPGLRDLLDQLRRRRAEMLAEGDPDGRMAELTRQLDEIEQDERAAIDELVEDAANSGDQRRSEVTDDVATERRMALDLQPDDPAGRISSLQHYDFVSSEARERFEELVEELRREMADTFFEGASDALSNMSPEQMARMRDAYDALNKMLEQRERGEELDPSFEEFMAQYGDMFPGDPQTLDELLEQLAERMAAAQAVWNSLSPEQQAQLRGLMEAVLEDMDLRWQVERLAQNLQRAVPDAGWQRAYDFNGEGPMSLEPGHRPGQPTGPARPDGGGAPVGLHPGRPRRDRPRPGAPAHGRGRGPGARPPGQADQVAGRRRADRAARRPDRADAPGACGGWARRRSPTCSARSTRTASATTRPCAPARATTGRRRRRPMSTATR